MKLYRTATGTWAGTQSDAGKGFTQVDVPTDKPGLLAFLNTHATGDAVETVDAGGDPVLLILESNASTFGRYLEAALERLGELGEDGWKALRRLQPPNRTGATSIERGLRFLTLAQYAELDGHAGDGQ